MDTGVIDKTAALLSRLYVTSTSIRTLVEDAGVNGGLVPLPPDGTTSFDYWKLVLHELSKGLTPNAHLALLGLAAKRYPYNPELREHLARSLPPKEIAPQGTTEGRVFISYSSSDLAAVTLLTQKLALTRDSVWLDVWNVQAGQDFVAAIANGLSRTQSMLYIIGSTDGKWQSLELNTAIALEVAGRLGIVPVLLPLTSQQRLPTLLRARSLVTLASLEDEPALARLREALAGFSKDRH